MVEAVPRRAHRADRDVGVRMGCAAVAFGGCRSGWTSARSCRRSPARTRAMIIVVAIGSGTILDTSRFRMLLAEHSDGIDDVYLSVPTVLGRGRSSGRRSP